MLLIVIIIMLLYVPSRYYFFNRKSIRGHNSLCNNWKISSMLFFVSFSTYLSICFDIHMYSNSFMHHSVILQDLYYNGFSFSFILSIFFIFLSSHSIFEQSGSIYWYLLPLVQQVFSSWHPVSLLVTTRILFFQGVSLVKQGYSILITRIVFLYRQGYPTVSLSPTAVTGYRCCLLVLS